MVIAMSEPYFNRARACLDMLTVFSTFQSIEKLFRATLSRVCYEQHCVVAENVHTPSRKVFSTTPQPPPWNFRPRGYFGALLPPRISKFLKGCFCSPTPCFIRKGFSLRHRCKCQVKPTTYLTSFVSIGVVSF